MVPSTVATTVDASITLTETHSEFFTARSPSMSRYHSSVAPCHSPTRRLSLKESTVSSTIGA